MEEEEREIEGSEEVGDKTNFFYKIQIFGGQLDIDTWLF